MIELRQLQLFVVAAEHLHFRTASATAGVSVGHLSQTIGRLEAALGVPLFNRTGRGATLTPAGSLFLSEARHLLDQTDRSIATVKQVQASASEHLRIGFDPSVALPWLAGTLQEFAESEPSLLVSLTDDTPAALADDLMDHRVDVLLSTRGSERRRTESLLLDRTGLSLLIPTTDALAASDAVEIGELEQRPLILVSRTSNADLFDTFVGACHRAAFDPVAVQYVGTPAVVWPTTRLCGGIGVVPTSMTDYFSTEGVVARPIAESPVLDLLAVRRSAPTASAASEPTARLWQQLRARSLVE